MEFVVCFIIAAILVIAAYVLFYIMDVVSDILIPIEVRLENEGSIFKLYMFKAFMALVMIIVITGVLYILHNLK